MKKAGFTRIFTALLLAALLLLSGCSAAPAAGEQMLKEAAAATPAPTPTPAPVSAAPSPSAEPGDARKTVKVETVDELLKAISSDTIIELSGRSFNLTEALGYGKFGSSSYYWDGIYDDGFELVIEDVENLTIRAARSGTEIVTVPRYANVIKFVDCRNITLEGFTAGHSDGPGFCTGAVINLKNCRDVYVDNCDLYGCGTYGLELDGCRGVHAVDTTIRDCSYGAVYATNCADVLLDGCSIYGIDGFGGVISMRACRDCALINSLVRSCSCDSLTELYYTRNFYLAGCEISKNDLKGMFTVTTYPLVLEGCVFKNNALSTGWYHFDEWQEEDSMRAVDPEGREYSDEELAELTLMKDVTWTAPVVEAEPIAAPEADEEGVIHVSTVDELLAAIAPNARIFLEDGVYKLSDASGYGIADGDYYDWMSCMDGPGLVIHDVENLSITAGGTHRVRIAAEPRFCEVLTFERCDGLSLSGFTAGHTQAVSSCAGGVITFKDSANVEVADCSLYGCGIMGISTYSCKGLEVRTTEIYDCDAGAFYFIESKNISITKCNIHDIGGYIYQLYECRNVMADGKDIPEGVSN